MGFMLIIILMMVIGLVFVFFMKPKATEDKDFQLDNLLYSVVGTTVDGKTIGERIENCERGEECDTLEGNLTYLIDLAFTKSGYIVGRNIKGSSFDISGGMEYSHKQGNSTSRSIASITVVRNSYLKLKFFY